MRIPKGHPRFESLRIRELLVKGLRDGVVVPEGLLAHGRGETFDYLLGERTSISAGKAVRASAALMLISKSSVVSVNGNTAALVPREISRLASLIPAKVEVNLFHRSLERERKIAAVLHRSGVREVLGVGVDASVSIPGVSSRRKHVDPRGIGGADVVLVPLEDGDRAMALQSAGKRVVAVDLNPLSRTSQAASISIVDNVVRAFPRLIGEVGKLRSYDSSYLKRIVSSFDNPRNLAMALSEITEFLDLWRVGS